MSTDVNRFGGKPKILIVEDDADQRQLLTEALGVYYDDPQGRRIVAVASAKECLAAPLESFDIILQDLHLPDMPGLTLLEKILARADVPVIFVTGENSCAAAADAIRHGAMDYVVKLGDYLFGIPVLVDKNIRLHRMKKENERLQREHQAMLSELRVKNTQLQETLEQLKTLAITDHLTGLANRRHFAELLERHFSQACRYGFDLTCCMCDLDDYKQINDTLGHQLGDQVLVITADVIRSSLRSSDVACRYGGDEFVLLLPHTSIERGLAAGERIRQQLASESGHKEGLGRTVTMSVGVASLDSDHPANADALLSMADKALYVAKERPDTPVMAFSFLADKAGTAGA